MIKLSVPCECGGTLKRHSSYTGKIQLRSCKEMTEKDIIQVVSDAHSQL